MAKNYLITGGAGFIGSNYAKRLIIRGENVTIFDNLSRKGADKNLAWLETETEKRSFQFIRGDIRDDESLKKPAAPQDVVVHLAAQVAVTTSVVDPVTDFQINALGTLNVLEAARKSKKQPIMIFASTNKVYGGLDDLEILEAETRYYLKNYSFGIAEDRCIDFHSPYGCSKGCGDQYFRDYYRIYEIPTVVFRQSCIYGIRQFGVEDQGWVAWFVIASEKGIPLFIYGDGKQVRDLLYIDDLLDAYDLAIEKPEFSKGQIYNIGGGPDLSVSIWTEFSKILNNISEKITTVEFKEWRPGDQRVYISDIRKIGSQLSWRPKIDIQTGIKKLQEWVVENKPLFDS